MDTHIHVCMCIHVYKHIYVYKVSHLIDYRICICVYMYIYIHVYTYACMYSIHTCTWSVTSDDNEMKNETFCLVMT